MENENIITETFICKSVSESEDKNGNFIFEVEASNENLDLQNQKTLQTALEKSEKYFLTNGLISDDHQHKTRNPDGSVESHKDKIIGEPISVRFDKDTKKTFVKGLLYKGVEAAKPYINLLKNGSKLVKASIGGIMPKVKQNPDGTETVTSFMWNDLALTTSPVNWTVGSACFAKSISMIDFCKSLEAGSGTDSAEFTGGRSLQGEDLEKETKKIIDTADGDFEGQDKDDDFEKSDEEENPDEELDVIKSCIKAIDGGELISKSDIENYLEGCGFDGDKARETALEIIIQGGNKMKKSHFSSTIDDLLKDFPDSDSSIEKSAGKSPDKNVSDSLFDDDEIDDEDEKDDDADDSDSDDEDVKKCNVKKSFDEDDEGDYYDATAMVNGMKKSIDDLSEENADLRKSIATLEENLLKVTTSFSDYLKTPIETKTVMQKSLDGNDSSKSLGNRKPSQKDFELLKSCLVKAAHNKEISLEAVQFYSTEFQKSMHGQKIDDSVWANICGIVQANR